MLIQNKFQPVNIFRQILFLYGGLKGYLDNISVDLVSLFEQELNNMLNKSIFLLVFMNFLHLELDEEIITFLY